MNRRVTLLALALLAAGCAAPGEPAPTTPGGPEPGAAKNSVEIVRYTGSTGTGGCVVAAGAPCQTSLHGENQVYEIPHNETACRLRAIIAWTPNQPANAKLSGSIVWRDGETHEVVNKTGIPLGESPLVADLALEGRYEWTIEVDSYQRTDAVVGYEYHSIPQPFDVEATIFNGGDCVPPVSS